MSLSLSASTCASSAIAESAIAESAIAESAIAESAIAKPPVSETESLEAPEREPVLTERPVPGELSSPFGWRRDPVQRHGKRKRRKRHKGVDFVARRHTLVHAAGPGIVVGAKFSRGYGRVVIIDHGLGLETRYAHLQRIKVKEGEFLPAGAVLGTVGSSGRATGPHLHFEVRQDGVALPPEEMIHFDLPDCSERARDCKRKRQPKRKRRRSPNS